MYHAILQFTLSGAIVFIGVMTLFKVSRPREVPFAMLPLLFGLHEFTQGFVWLGVEGVVSPRAAEMAGTFYLLYAKGLLQFLVPLSVWLLETRRWRKRVLSILTVLGGLMTLYALWGLSLSESVVYVKDGALVYDTPALEHLWLALGYIVTTCGSLMLSESIALELYGLLNLVGSSLVYLYRPYAFTSLWCLYAAVLSGLLYLYFVERRISFLRSLERGEYVLGKKLADELERLQRRYPGIGEYFSGRRR
jgi:hypothetical protein